MTLRLDVPQTPNDPQTVSFFQLVPLLSIPAATNVLTVQLGGTTTLCLENRSAAGVMLQLFSTSAGNGQPYIEFLDPGRKRTYSFGVPLSRMVLSNMSVNPLPAPILGQIFPSQAPLQNLTAGYLMVSATSALLTAENAENVQSQTVTPGSGATQSFFSVSNTIGFNKQDLLPTVSPKPLSLFGLSIASEWSVVQAGAVGPASAEMQFGLRGTTSLKEVTFGLLCLFMPALTAAGSQRGAASDNIVFPFPVSLSAVFPNDAALQPFVSTDGAIAQFLNIAMNLLC